MRPNSSHRAETVSRQRQVVYILSTGSSAPLSIPTIVSFLQSPKGLGEEQPNQFSCDELPTSLDHA